MVEEPLLIDEEKLLLSLKDAPVTKDEPGLDFQALFTPFNDALKKYVSLNESEFMALMESLPNEKKPSDSDNFFELKFEDLMNMPVEMARKEIKVNQMNTTSRVESLHISSAKDLSQENDNSFRLNQPKMQLFTIALIQPAPYPVPALLSPPPVAAMPGIPTTPSILVNSQFTGGLNTEILLNTQQGIVFTGNVFHEGAMGGIYLNAYFGANSRSGSSENRTFPDRVILTTPEGNTFTLYTTSNAENWIGDFVYEFNHALPHKLNTPGLDVVVESGHKVITDHFLYSLSNNSGPNVGKIDIEIIDDIPVATNQTGTLVITEADINAMGSNQTNKALILSGDLFSDPTFAKNRIGPDGGTVFDINMGGIGETVIATKTTLTLTTPQGNELVVNRITGNYSYTLNQPFDNTHDPHTSFAQAQDIFTYEFLDNDGDSASATLTITILDDKPVANAKLTDAQETAYFVNSAETKTGNLITDDDGFGVSLLGADGATITKINNIADGADLDGTVNGIISVGTTYGSIVVYTTAQLGHQVGDYIYSLDGAKTVLVNDALLQVQDIISYQLTDADSPTTSSSQLTITINLNQAPTANDDTGSTNEDTVLNVNAASGVLANDTDPNAGDTKVVGKVNGVANDVGNSIVLPSGATFQLNADGAYSYDSRVAFNYLAQGESTTDVIAYTMRDAEGLTSTANLTITITGVNDAPTANDDSNTTHGNVVINVNSTLDPNALLANDTDPDTTDVLVISAVNGVGANVGNQFALPSGALLTVNADGTYQYDPNGKFPVTGSDNFTYTLSDGHGGTDTATVTISIIVPPIVLDLNNDGIISLLSLEDSSVTWQFPCGNYHFTGWVGPQDGLLVFDANHDGKITLLSEFSFAENAKTDLEGFKLNFDSNNDGVFDSNDLLFSQAGIWQDINSNGLTEPGELYSLIDWGIKSIFLTSVGEQSEEQGNVIFGFLSYETEDGKLHLAADVGLRVGPEIALQDVVSKQDELDLAFTPTDHIAPSDLFLVVVPASFLPKMPEDHALCTG